MEVEKELKMARLRAGLSQRRLAEKAGVPQSTVGRIETGVIDPKVTTLNRLLGVCGYALDVQPRLGAGVDRSQIRELLELTPRQRADNAVAAARNVGRLLSTIRRRST